MFASITKFNIDEQKEILTAMICYNHVDDPYSTFPSLNNKRYYSFNNIHFTLNKTHNLSNDLCICTKFTSITNCKTMEHYSKTHSYVYRWRI